METKNPIYLVLLNGDEIVAASYDQFKAQRICTRAALKTGAALSVAKVYGLDSETYTELVNARMFH